MGHARLTALGALYELHWLNVLMAAAVAAALAGNPLLGCSTHDSLVSFLVTGTRQPWSISGGRLFVAAI
jgi:hypothetical protein